MLTIHGYCLRITAILAGSVLIPGTAAALDREEVVAICEEFLATHPLETEWESACVNAIKEFSSLCFVGGMPESECVAGIEELGSLNWSTAYPPAESIAQTDATETSETE
jgi:hypothetical protein